MQTQDEFDVVVVGSGAGGLTAGLTAALNGLSAVIIEKTPHYGGATAISGGGVWIPNNHVLAEQHVGDSAAKGKVYMDATVGDRVSEVRRDRYLEDGPKMIEEFDQKTRWMRWTYMRGYPDYYPELPGGFSQGRSIEPELIDARELGEDLALMRPPIAAMGYKGLIITASDFHDLNMVMRAWSGKRAAVRVAIRTAKARITKRAQLTAGRALTARLRLAVRDAGVPVWVSTPLVDLVTTEDAAGIRVSGVTVERNGEKVVIGARHGVVLAAGGFSHSQEMRDKYHPAPSSKEWTMAPEGQTGDAIEAGLRLGAALDLMDKVWGQPSTMVPVPGTDQLRPQHLLAERSSPSTMVVNGAGKRYQNEAVPYPDFVDGMYKNNSPEALTVPSWMIFDQRAKDRYLILRTLPRAPFPKDWIAGGFVKKAPTIEALAGQIGTDPAVLAETLRRYNGFARAGKDEDFGKGDSAYDRYYGDPTLPNPCLHPIDKGPFYAIQVYPTDTSTKGGLLVDENAQVVREDGSTIRGLYASGNTSASVMGETYPGPGSTIGPAMVLSYSAVKHMAAEGSPAAK